MIFSSDILTSAFTDNGRSILQAYMDVTKIPPFLLIPMSFLMDQLFETVVEWISPIFVCTQYHCTDEEFSRLDLPFIGREASCYHKANMAFFILSFILLFVVSSVIAAVYTSRVRASQEHNERSFGSASFTIFQAYFQLIQVAVAVFKESKPWPVDLVAFLTSLILGTASISFITHKLNNFSRTLDPFIYYVSAITSLLSMISELASNSVKVLSLISFVFIVIGMIIIIIVTVQYFTRICHCRKVSPYY